MIDDGYGCGSTCYMEGTWVETCTSKSFCFDERLTSIFPIIRTYLVLFLEKN